jgi:hypothetical protein
MSELVLKYNNNELDQLSKDVIELDETFRMVNDLVSIQSEKIDFLIDSVDNTLSNVENGNKELIVSKNLQYDGNKKKILLTGLGLSVLSISTGSFLGYTLPIVLIGFGCYKMIEKIQ